jgi:uncharacterized protein
MNNRHRVLLIGDTAELAPYHPLHRIEEELRSILGERFAVESHTAYRQIGLQELRSFGLCISYADCWGDTLSDTLAEGLSAYTEQGGSMLVIHNGISLQAHEELYRLVGAKFTGHPPYQTLSFRVAQPEHPVMHGIPSFTLDEEPYQYEYHTQAQLDILMEYECNGQTVPAVWVTHRGAGRLVYVMPGHHAPTFRHPIVRYLLRNCAEWLAAKNNDCQT